MLKDSESRIRSLLAENEDKIDEWQSPILHNASTDLNEAYGAFNRKNHFLFRSVSVNGSG